MLAGFNEAILHVLIWPALIWGLDRAVMLKIVASFFGVLVGGVLVVGSWMVGRPYSPLKTGIILLC